MGDIVHVQVHDLIGTLRYRADVLDDQFISTAHTFMPRVGAMLEKAFAGMGQMTLTIEIEVPKLKVSAITPITAAAFEKAGRAFAMDLKSAKIKAGLPMITIDDEVPF